MPTFRRKLLPPFTGHCEDRDSSSSETLVSIYQIIRRHIPEDCNLNIHRYKNLKPHPHNAFMFCGGRTNSLSSFLLCLCVHIFVLSSLTSFLLASAPLFFSSLLFSLISCLYTFTYISCTLSYFPLLFLIFVFFLPFFSR
jgi:hypothetical protein